MEAEWGCIKNSVRFYLITTKKIVVIKLHYINNIVLIVFDNIHSVNTCFDIKRLK